MQEKSTHIIQELQEISPVVANLTLQNVYTVMPDYFDNLASEILQQIRTNKLLEQAKGDTYIAPNGYFTTFPLQMLQKINDTQSKFLEVENELLSIAPTLNTINKTNIYSVPNNYFNESVQTVTVSQKAKIVSIVQIKKWVGFAVAAIFIGVLAVSIIRSISPTTPEINIAKEVAKTSDEDIETYLSTTPTTDIFATTTIIDDTESVGLFEATSTEEIKLYLQEQPEMVEITN